MAAQKKAAGWSELKAHLIDVDKAELLALLKDLYGANKDTQKFLHARYGLGDVLAPYKATISQWINPRDVRMPYSVSKAKKAITDYKKAVGLPSDLAQLYVFYCEEVFVALERCGVEDEAFYDSLCVMFAQALAAIQKLAPAEQQPLLARMWEVRTQGNPLGWGVGDDFADAWETAGLPAM